MAIFSRTKRVTDPLDDEAKARIFRHVTILNQDSPRLCELVHEFIEDCPENESQALLCDSDTDLSENCAMEYSGEANEDTVRMALGFSDSDPYRNLLLSHVLRAVEANSALRSTLKSMFRDKVASFLRDLGHDATVCVTKWSSSAAKLTAGSYHFIDVVYNASGDVKNGTSRYFVDLDFASEFEIARPTWQFARVLQLLPNVFVGKEENLKKVVRACCEAAKNSLMSRGLSLPPWRRSSYLRNKWFGPYKRKVESCFGVTPLNKEAVRCRSMGFDNAVNNRLFIRT
ncbi:unnamed protein product [Cochlearia groenlandica]